MKLSPIQIFRHNGYAFHSNDSATVIYYGTIFCIVLLKQ